MKRRLMAVLVPLAVLAAGCSSDGGDAAAPPPSGLDTSSVSAPSTSAAATGVIRKAVGEVSGVGCDPGQTPCTDLLQFTVSDISTARGCSTPVADGKRYLHVAVSASVAATVSEEQRSAVATLLTVGNWRIIGADGFTSTNLDVGASCQYDAGPFYDQMVAGSKQRGDVVFVVPADARTLELRAPGVRDGWQWAIPVA